MEWHRTKQETDGFQVLNAFCPVSASVVVVVSVVAFTNLALIVALFVVVFAAFVVAIHVSDAVVVGSLLL